MACGTCATGGGYIPLVTFWGEGNKGFSWGDGDMRYQGKLIEWNDDRGFGFVEPYSGGRKIFVHIKSFVSRPRRPLVNDILVYDLKIDARGRQSAANVCYDLQGIQLDSFNKKNILFIILSVLFLLFIVGSAYLGKLPIMLVIYYFVVSFIAYFVYDLDKSAAEEGEWRFSENMLHSMSILGGWPGALFAQVMLRHKSKKQSFRTVFWATVILNCLLLFSLFTENGSSFMKSILWLV